MRFFNRLALNRLLSKLETERKANLFSQLTACELSSKKLFVFRLASRFERSLTPKRSIDDTNKKRYCPHEQNEFSRVENNA
jgi:hypothetical protein